jgi:dienelactone hydrolase
MARDDVAERVVVLGYSFGGAVAIRTAPLTAEILVCVAIVIGRGAEIATQTG